MHQNYIYFVCSVVNRCTSYTDPRLGKNASNYHTKRLDGYSNAMHVLNGENLTGKVAVVTGSNSGIGKHWKVTCNLHLSVKLLFMCGT